MKIITVTVNPALDISTSVDRVVAEKKLRCSEPEFDAGGGGLNVSRAIKNLGGSSLAIFTSGGTAGKKLEKILEDEKIETKPVKISGDTRESITVSENSSEDQYRFVFPGPKLSEEEWKKILTTLDNLDEKPEYIVASGSLSPGIPEEFYSILARKANELNAKIIIDTSGKALSRILNEKIFLIKPNMNEVKYIMNEEIKDETDLEDKLRSLIDKSGVENILLSLGSGGGKLINKEGCVHYRAPTVPIKSKVGAGDSTIAGVTLALSKGENIKSAVLFGIAAGAAAVMTPGTDLCNKEDTERLFNKMKNDLK